LTLQTAYTYAKAIDPTTGGGNNFDLDNVSNPYAGWKYDNGPSIFDRTNVAFVNFVYDIPFLKNSDNHLMKSHWRWMGSIGNRHHGVGSSAKHRTDREQYHQYYSRVLEPAEPDRDDLLSAHCQRMVQSRGLQRSCAGHVGRFGARRVARSWPRQLEPVSFQKLPHQRIARQPA